MYEQPLFKRVQFFLVIILPYLRITHSGDTAICQVRSAFRAAQETLVHPEHLVFRVNMATQAVLDFPVDLEIPGVRVFRAVRDLRDFSVPLAQQVSVFLYSHLLTYCHCHLRT